MATAVDSFIHIIEENNLSPEDIVRVKARVWPVTHYGWVAENDLRSPGDFSFKPPYAMACAAHRIHPARWLDAKVRQAPEIREFMQRVEWDIGCDEKEFGLARLQDPQAELGGAEVMAKGHVFTRMARYRKGLWRPEEFRNSDEELAEKFRENASTALPLEKANIIVQTVFQLDRLEDTMELTQLLAP